MTSDPQPGHDQAIQLPVLERDEFFSTQTCQLEIGRHALARLAGEPQKAVDGGTSR